MPRLTVLHHDNCFDGMASAVLFSRLYHGVVDAKAKIKYRGVHHRLGNPFEARWFDGEDNAVLDFRYTLEPKLTWWFDHHVSAFASPEERAHFEADRSGQRFYDPAARSCTKFIARVARERFDARWPDLDELIEWADVIDGAAFADARTAVALEAPALRIMTVVEANRERDFIPRLIELLLEKPLGEVAERPEIEDRLAPLLAKHQKAIELLRARARMERGVVTYDLCDENLDAFNKFIVYHLFPECDYTVGVSRSETRVKVSVGSNPWSPRPRAHNLAKICERHGGGGHPVVGAISLPPGDLERARKLAAEIAEELRGPPRA